MKEVKVMKKGIHPDFVKCTVKCACGAVVDTMSTKGDMRVEICSKCHSFFTGKQKLLDTEGMVEKFNKRFAKTEGKTLVRKPKTEVKAKAKLKKPVAKKVAVKKPAKKAAAKAEKAEEKAK